MPRLFFALWPDDDARAAVAVVADALRLVAGHKVPAANYHLTLAFLGEVDHAAAATAQAIGAAIHGASFTMSLNTFGWWRKPAVAWIAPSDPLAPLVDLAQTLGNALRVAGIPVEAKAYRPHLTLARKVTARPVLEHEFEVRWSIGALHLIESRAGAAGVRYEPIAHWPWRPDSGCDVKQLCDNTSR